MKQIPVGAGVAALVDDIDYERLAQFTWRLNKKKYAARQAYQGDGTRQKVYMHREILGLQKGDPRHVDHRDGNPLNNVRSNLRFATQLQNNRNIGMISTNTSGFKGVSWSAMSKKWQVNINANGKTHYFGLYQDVEIAGYVAKCALKALHGEFANDGNGPFELEIPRVAATVPTDDVRRIIGSLIGQLEHADVRDGYCCCGDPMEGHSNPMDCGHSAVDAGEYSAGTVIAEARAILARQPAAVGQWVHCSPSLLNAGVSCANTPRRACECNPENGGHDHFIAHAAAPSVEQDERGAFEAWAKKQGYRFNEGDLRNAKSWALAAWMARAAVQQAEPSTGICFFCGEPINGEHESDCPQAARAASTSANVAQGAEAPCLACVSNWPLHDADCPDAAPPAQTALTDAQWLELRRIARTYNETGFPKHAREFFAALTAAQSASGDAK